MGSENCSDRSPRYADPAAAAPTCRAAYVAGIWQGLGGPKAFVSYQRYRRVKKPLFRLVGPGGNSTKPSVRARAVKSPDPLVGQGVAQGRPQSSCVTLTGINPV